MRETVKLSAALAAREVVKDRGCRYTEQTELPHAPIVLEGSREVVKGGRRYGAVGPHYH